MNGSVVIATHGTEHIGDCLKSFQTDLDVIIARNGSYDYGKYRKHMGRYEQTLFMHDSARVSHPNFIANGMALLLEGYDLVVPYWFRPNHYDSPEQRQWVQSQCGSDDYDVGVFGPIFFASRRAQDVLDQPIEVQNKMQQQGMERGIGVLAKGHGLRVWTGSNVTSSFGPVLRGVQGLTKVFPCRS